LLMRHEKELTIFRSSARRPGFAAQLVRSFSELEQHQVSAPKLRAFAARPVISRELKDKLHDLALLLEAYMRWLEENVLQDSHRLLDFATDLLRKELGTQNSELRIDSLWLDGFAEMTPQELDLLASVAPFCERATFAFCLDDASARPGEILPNNLRIEPLNRPQGGVSLSPTGGEGRGEGARVHGETKDSWLSLWSTVAKSFQQCRLRVAAVPDMRVEIEFLLREAKATRFSGNRELALLEKAWAAPVTQHAASDLAREDACPADTDSRPAAISITSCADPESEAIFAAREILKFVRAGHRYRDCAVIVRDLGPYYKPLASAFRRYGVPFFLDRRESVAHHPLAELTRSAFRLVADDWPHEDWFAALKAGFAPAGEAEIDALENAALEFGWRGERWRETLPDENLERLRQKILPPFTRLAARLGDFKFAPTGPQLAETLRDLWSDLGVEEILERWSSAATDPSSIANRQSSIHLTVWDEMNAWLDNLALAFPREPMPLREWVPILEAGLSTLTVGVIPPVLDEVPICERG